MSEYMSNGRLVLPHRPSVIEAPQMAVLKEIFSSNTFYMWVTVSTCLYFVTLAIYRLYFSPLAKFPGPKLAGLTFNVEFYHDVIRRGQYTFEIAKMHEKYGENNVHSSQWCFLSHNLQDPS